MTAKVNEIKISYREQTKMADAPQLTSSRDVAALLHHNWDADTLALKESFKIILLNNSNRVKGIYQVSDGGITGTVVDLRILFAVVLKTTSTGICLAHNHPSGNLNPSQSDKQLTQKIKRAAALFDIKVVDHVIIVPNGDYFSFADNGIL